MEKMVPSRPGRSALVLFKLTNEGNKINKIDGVLIHIEHLLYQYVK
jgi:hypothetical protein